MLFCFKLNYYFKPSNKITGICNLYLKKYYKIIIFDKFKNKNKTYDFINKEKENKNKINEKIFDNENKLNNEKLNDQNFNISVQYNKDIININKKSFFFESERIIKCISGKGGNGCISFKKYKRKVFNNLGIPNGGKGGNGGSIYFCYLDNIKEIRKIKKNNLNKYMYIKNLDNIPCVIYANNGEDGKKNQMKGKDGKNIYINLNKFCFVYELIVTECTNNEINEQDNGINEQDNGINEQDNEINKQDNEINEQNNKINNNINVYKGNYENIYNIIKKHDPLYIKRNNHILKGIINFEKKIKKEIFLGLLNEMNNCILVSKGGNGGKGNNINNIDNYEKGQNGQVKYIKIIYKCISDVCLIGTEKSGKYSLLSLISNKMYTANNFYIIKNILFKDKYEISIAHFFNQGYKENILNDKMNENNSFNINPNLFKYLEMSYLIVIVLDFQKNILNQFLNIRNELKEKCLKVFEKPYIIVINKCDINFNENIKKTEESYNELKHYSNNAPIFLISCKYSLGIDKFVNYLRYFKQNLTQKC